MAKRVKRRGRVERIRMGRARAREKYEARRTIHPSRWILPGLSIRVEMHFSSGFVRACIQCAATEKRRNNSAAGRAFSYLPREINEADLSRPLICAAYYRGESQQATISAARFLGQADKSQVFFSFLSDLLRA